MRRRRLLELAGTGALVASGCTTLSAPGDGAARDWDYTCLDLSLVEKAVARESRFRVALHPKEAGGGAVAERERVQISVTGESYADVGGLTVTFDSGRAFEFTRASLPDLVDDRDGELVVRGGTGFLLVSDGGGDAVMKSDPPIYVVDLNRDVPLLADGAATVTLRDDGGGTLVEKQYRCADR